MIKRLLIISLFFASCSGEIPRGDQPADLIPKDQMIDVMTELVKLESFIQSTYATVDRYHNAMKASGDSLMKAKGVTYEQFDHSMDYYAARQDEMVEIYSEVLNELNKELGDIESK